MSFKNNLLIGGMVSAGILIMPIYIVLLLGISYLSLIGINTIIGYFPLLAIDNFEIEIVPILLFSILLSVTFKQTNKADTSKEEWITNNLNLHFERLDQMNEKLEDVQDLKQYVESIDMAVSDIKERKNA